MVNPTNRERLVEAGIIKTAYVFTPDQLQIIEQLTPEEVDTLIGIANRLGEDFLWNTGGGDEDTVGVLF
jgi:hypothetical protein